MLKSCNICSAPAAGIWHALFGGEEWHTWTRCLNCKDPARPYSAANWIDGGTTNCMRCLTAPSTGKFYFTGDKGPGEVLSCDGCHEPVKEVLSAYRTLSWLAHSFDKVKAVAKCTCPLPTLMSVGCKCGQMRNERRV